jgi:hypothetical protein
LTRSLGFKKSPLVLLFEKSTKTIVERGPQPKGVQNHGGGGPERTAVGKVEVIVQAAFLLRMYLNATETVVRDYPEGPY